MMSTLRRRFRSNEEGDYVIKTQLADLPTDLLQQILCGLPFKDVARTSVLSKQWRSISARVPHINVTEGYCYGAPTSRRYLEEKDKLFRSIYEVFLRRLGPILKFRLSVFGLRSCQEIDNVVEFLSRNGIEDLTLEVHLKLTSHGYEGYHLMPSYIYSCSSLKQLTLTGFTLKPPTTLRFEKIVSLDLNECDFSSESIERLVSGCPLLEKLSVKYYGLSSIRVADAPNLREASFTGGFAALSLENVPKLRRVKMAAALFESTFVDIFRGLQGVEILEVDFLNQDSLDDNMVDYMGAPLLAFNNLKSLRLLKVNLVARFLKLRALLLMRSSPKLESVWIEFSTAKRVRGRPNKHAMARGLSTLSLDRLYNVRLECVTCDELEFVKLFLAKAPNVRRLTIWFWKDVRVAARREVTQYIRALPWAPLMSHLKISTYDIGTF